MEIQTLTGTCKWEDYVNSSPVNDIFNALTELGDKCQIIRINLKIIRILINHPDIICLIKNAGFKYEISHESPELSFYKILSAIFCIEVRKTVSNCYAKFCNITGDVIYIIN